MNRQKFAERSRRHVRIRPQNAAALIARNLIVRALRQHDLHHVLRGRPAFVGFVVHRAEDIEVFANESLLLLRETTEKKAIYDVMAWLKENARKVTNATDTIQTLSDKRIVFGFASDRMDMPDAFRSLADGIVILDPVDERALAATFQTLFHRTPSTSILSAAATIPIDVLNICLQRGLTLRQAAGRIQRYLSASREPQIAVASNHPRLENLAGLGEVADWGKSLARDILDYRERRIPWTDVDRGVLVSGASGTGKTMFVRSLGTTCGVPVHVHSLARWQARGHLGDLLKAMRSAFDEAIKSAPSILFIDEIDAVGNRRDLRGPNEKYSREVVNALLECLDGAEARQGVVVVAATNYPEKIDPALLRPGRLDRHLRIPLPDCQARLTILRYHLGHDLPAVDLADIATHLDGATGAIIEQVVRDARRRARHARRPMTTADLEHGLPSRIRLSEAALRRLCVHEAGHAFVGSLLSAESGSTLIDVRVMQEITQQNTGGQTTFRRTPGFDRSRTSYLAEITTLLAGLAAEDVVLGGHADGGGGEENSDIHLATILAARMDASLGLGGSLVYLTSDDPAEILAQVRRDSHLRRQVHARLKACAHRARTIISQNTGALELLETSLAHRRHLTAADISALLREINPDKFSSNCDLPNSEKVTQTPVD
ncbi:AAA family ATPase [Tardiphaga sp. 172_B4_N1_3]|uniref:AAA family ATPase n=1 Tax=Tardiphaga sp. 172_B4_N1_3 TaxID=3240787 RepID=UPI003F89629E